MQLVKLFPLVVYLILLFRYYRKVSMYSIEQALSIYVIYFSVVDEYSRSLDLLTTEMVHK